ncbi:ATP-binding cassette domain-containing protein, partial [Variovorax sp.]|uniref:ATP-binding cassette domain-containing protein n=1 Tax=Variovorax sp. TaxID=1871043 RepID=UPI0025E329D4
MNTGIEFRDVTKRYGADRNAPLAVKGISFEVPEGTVATTLGPSACGKTTTLPMIPGPDSPTSGAISMGGRDVPPLGPAQRHARPLSQT